MGATDSGAAPGTGERLAALWLARNGPDLEPVPPSARHLLATRLAARRRAAWTAAPLLLAAVVTLTSVLPDLWTDADQTAWAHRFATRYLVAGVLVAAGGLIANESTRRADTRIGAELPRRVARGEYVPVRIMLGVPATLMATVSATLGIAWGVVMLGTRRDELTWTWLAWLVLAGVSTTVGLRRALDRPAVAVDPSSLAIDERLRSVDAADATKLLWIMWIAVMPASVAIEGWPRWIARALILSTLLVQALYLWSRLHLEASR